MDVPDIVKAIDDRIATLRQVRDLLSATAVPATEKRAKEAVAAIRPKAGAKMAKPANAVSPGGRKTMSDEGRARIAAAQKKRWALSHAAKAAGTKGAGTKTAAPAKAAKTVAGNVAGRTPAKKAVAVKTSVAKKAAMKKVPAAPKPTPEGEPTPAATEETAS